MSSGAWSALRAWELGTEMAEPQSQVWAAWTLPEGSGESGGRVLGRRVTQSGLTSTVLVMWQICWWGNDSRQMRPWMPRKEPSSPGSQSSQVICASDSRAWPTARAWHRGPGQLSSAQLSSASLSGHSVCTQFPLEAASGTFTSGKQERHFP